MWWWVSAFFILLVAGEYVAALLANVVPMAQGAADTMIVRALIVTFLGAAICIGLDIKEGIRAAYTKFADRLGMDVEPHAGDTFPKEVSAPPWTSWARASGFTIREVMRSRSREPAFWIFDLHYREQVLGMKRATITTFFVVKMDPAAPAQVQEWMVPKGYRALRCEDYLYVYRVRSWFGGGDRLGITAIPDVLRVALLIASDVDSLGQSHTAELKERVTLAMEAASGLNEFRPVLLALAWGLLATLLSDLNIPGRPLVDMVVIQAAFGCAVYGSVWRRDRNPTFIIFLWLVSIALYWMPPVAMVLLAFAAVEATLGIRSIAGGLHAAAVLGVGLCLYGMQHNNLVIALLGGPLVMLIAFVQDLCARSKHTKRNDKGWLEWQVKSLL